MDGKTAVADSKPAIKKDKNRIITQFTLCQTAHGWHTDKYTKIKLTYSKQNLLSSQLVLRKKRQDRQKSDLPIKTYLKITN